MYKNIYYENEETRFMFGMTSLVISLYLIKNTPYVKKCHGFHHTLDGDKVKKVYQWDDDDPNLFESDVPITTRFLVDNYTDSDDVSEGVRTFFFDIEVEVVDGFPDVMKANEKITSMRFMMR